MSYPTPTLQTVTVQGAATLASVGVSGGTIDATAIGATTPAAVHATTLNTSGAAVLASVSTTAATITGGTIDATAIGATTPAAVHALTLSTPSATITGGTIDATTITGGTIDATAIGTTTPAAVHATTLNTSGAATLASVSSVSATLTGGTIDGMIVGGTTPAAIHATTVSSSGAATLASVSSASATITGGSVDGATIGATTPAPIHATTLTASGTVTVPSASAGTSPPNLNQLAATTGTTGASLVGYLHNGTSATGRTLQAKTSDLVSALDFGAVGDGVTDDTAAIQAWVNYLSTSGKMGLLPATTNSYMLTSTITATGAIRIYGEGVTPYIGGLVSSGINTRGPGSWLYFNHAAIGVDFSGGANGFAGIEVRNIGTIRLQPTPNGGTYTPAAAGYDFMVDNCDALFVDVCLLNPSYGIKLINGNYGRLRCVRLTGQPLINGVVVDTSYDSGFIKDCRWWPYWTDDVGVRAYMLHNATAYTIGRWDDGVMSGNFSIGYLYHLYILQNANGTANRLRVNGEFADEGGYFCVIDGSATQANTITIGNCKAIAQVSNPIAQCSNFLILGSNQNVILNDCDFNVPQLDCVRVQGSGNSVRIGQIAIGGWNQSNSSAQGILAATSGNTIIMDSIPVITSASSGATQAVASVAGSTVSAPLGRGATTLTTGAGGTATITLPIAVTPRSCLVTPFGANPYHAQPTAYGVGTVIVTFTNPNGSNVGSGVAITANWQAAF